MASVFKRVNARKAYPVETSVGTLHVCEMTFGEIDRVSKLGNSTALSLALMLVNADGSKLVAQLEGETDQQLAERMQVELQELTPSDMRAIQDAFNKLTKPADADAIVKN